MAYIVEQTHHSAHTNMEYENTMVLSSKTKKKSTYLIIAWNGRYRYADMCLVLSTSVTLETEGGLSFVRSWGIEEEMAVDIISAKMVEQYQHR